MRTVIFLTILAIAAAGCRGTDPPRHDQPPPAGQAPAPAPPQTSDREAAQPDPGSLDASAQPTARPGQPRAQIAGPTAPLAPDTPGAAPAHTAPRYREVTLPAGTELALTLETGVASDTSRVEDAVRASLRRPIIVDGMRVIPAGSDVRGSVVDVQRSGKVKGRARVSLRFTDLVMDDERIDLQTTAITREARATKRRDAAKVGVPAAGGAVLGAIIGGGKGAAIGATVGGGAGAAMVMTTRGEEVRLSAGAPLTVRLTAPVVVRVRE